MANKRITDVDFAESLNSNESFFINQNNSIKQISRNNVLFGIANGGTGATTIEDARANLEVYSKEEVYAKDEIYSKDEVSNAIAKATSAIGKELDIITEKINTVHSATITTEWEGESAPYTQAIIVSEMTMDDNPVVDLVLSDDYETSQSQLKEWSKIYRIVTRDSAIMVYATAPTDIDLSIQLKN